MYAIRSPRRCRAGGRLAVLFAVAVAVLASVPGAIAASTWYVATTGSDANDCMTSSTPCQTIQEAINKASAGDTISVAAGTYPELAVGPLTVSKTLTLTGAQVGVDARSRAGAESVIADVQGTSVAASNVVIDGFTVQGSSVAAFTGYGIWVNPGRDGTQIVNNIIQDNIAGIGLANAGGTQAVIRHNLIRNNTRPGGASGSGIYTDQFVGGPTVRNVLVDENTFSDHSGTGGAINISNEDFANGVFGLTVTDNLFTANSRAFVLFNTHDSLFDGNRISGSTFVGSADVRIFDSNSGLTFTNNDLSNGAGHAVRLSALSARPSSNVVFHYNNFENYTLTGLTVDVGSHTGTVNAECNWWNSPTGPMNPGNPGGTGEEVVGDADFTPWLIARAPGGACIGGRPSTPGKVTGGGQIQGDPVFSPLGELISLPAIVPSATGGSMNATFGFTARCCPATGNLVYQDHGMNVRIKATSISSLFISDGSCGPRTHAQFVGTASVTRTTGTTTESFTVDVDDCGEPGTIDTFGIQTTTYSNGPSVLIGGNIQIH
jgi:Right handed beta helix region